MVEVEGGHTGARSQRNRCQFRNVLSQRLRPVRHRSPIDRLRSIHWTHKMASLLCIHSSKSNRREALVVTAALDVA